MKKSRCILLSLNFLLIIGVMSGCAQTAPDSSQATDLYDSNTNVQAKAEEEKSSESKEKTSQNLETAQGIILKTNFGDITISFFKNESPKTVKNFLTLAEQNFYDGVKFHRVIKGFMIQSGDPNSKDDDWSDDGIGGPGYFFEDEKSNKKFIRGTVAMANIGKPNTNGSQFFIVTNQNASWLEGGYTVFGEVVSGIDVVSKIESLKVNEKDHPLDDAVIKDAVILQNITQQK